MNATVLVQVRVVLVVFTSTVFICTFQELCHRSGSVKFTLGLSFFGVLRSEVSMELQIKKKFTNLHKERKKMACGQRAEIKLNAVFHRKQIIYVNILILGELLRYGLK